MGNRYDVSELDRLTSWAQQAAQRLQLKPLAPADVELVLSSAAQASTGLVRSAGPVAMYLAGLLVASGQAPDVSTACRMVGRLMAIPELMIDDVEHPPKGFPDR